MSDFLDELYEAATLPDRWPAVLHQLAINHCARGAVLFRASSLDTAIALSPEVVPLFERYVGEGWMARNDRGRPMIEEHAPFFRTDADFHTMQERTTMPVYRDLLNPTGFAVGAGTVIQGPSDDMIVLTVEGLTDDTTVRRMLPRLDRLRPHIARAASLSARIALHWSRRAVDTLQQVGTPAAVIDADGGIRAFNAMFGEVMGDRCYDFRRRLRVRSLALAARIDAAITVVRQGGRAAATVVVPAHGEMGACVLHIMPLRRASRDLFESDGLLLVLADPRNRGVPQAGMLRLLFDLTPSEAMLAIELVGGHALRDAAVRRGIRYSTARAQLRSIFLKTDCRRQSELVLLLSHGISTVAAA